ncbi:MAG: hypothetical protein RL207_1879 [Bacteroidota bacterium]|jgi:hypothetical protein
MKLSEFKANLTGMTTVSFQLPNGSSVPAHYHITEVGHVQKRFIDCGGTTRLEDRICFQLWEAEDFDHRLQAEKLMKIIELSERTLNLPDEEIEVEYQGSTIGKYQLAWNGTSFELLSTTTACLAEDKCGIPPAKQKISLVELTLSTKSTCTPGGGCC